MSLSVVCRIIWGGPQDVCRGCPRDVGRRRPLALHIGLYGYVLRRSVQDVHGMSVGDALGVTYRTVLGRPLDVTFSRPQDVSSGRLLALHRGSYGDVHKTSFAGFLRTSSGRNFAEWDQLLLHYLVYLNQLQQFLIF